MNKIGPRVDWTIWIMIIFMVAAALGVFGFGSGGFESGVGP